MLPQLATATQPADGKITRIGVGIDTSRYGHYAAFVHDDFQPAAGELQFVESALGYAQLRARFEQIRAKLGNVHFCVRLDAAGQYADNLLHFLNGLGESFANASGSGSAMVTISCGDPQRNKNYRAALFGAKKSDPVEARAAARYALAEKTNGGPRPLRRATHRSARSPAGSRRSCANARASSISSITFSPRSPFLELMQAARQGHRHRLGPLAL